MRCRLRVPSHARSTGGSRRRRRLPLQFHCSQRAWWYRLTHWQTLRHHQSLLRPLHARVSRKRLRYHWFRYRDHHHRQSRRCCYRLLLPSTDRQIHYRFVHARRCPRHSETRSIHLQIHLPHVPLHVLPYRPSPPFPRHSPLSYPLSPPPLRFARHRSSHLPVHFPPALSRVLA